MILSVAIRSLLVARRRTLPLAVALFFVAFLTVIVAALTAGIKDNMVRSTTAMWSGHVNVGGAFKVTPTNAPAVITRVAELRAAVKEAVPDAVRIVDRGRGRAKIVSEHGSIQLLVNGIDLAQEPSFFQGLALAHAREYLESPAEPERTPGDFQALTKAGIVIFANQAKRLRVEVGDVVTLRVETMRGQTNTMDFTVVAIAQSLGPLSWLNTFVTKEATAELFQLKRDVSGVLQVNFDDIGKTDAGRERVRAALVAKGFVLFPHVAEPFFVKAQTVTTEDWQGQRYQLTTWEEEASSLVWILKTIATLSSLLLATLAIVVIIGITNTMYISVRDRTREIGTLRAIGMSRSRVLRMVLVEALALGFAATAMGGVVGVIVATVVTAASVSIDSDAVRMILLSDTVHLRASAGSLLATVVALTGLVGVAAIPPALRATRIAPVTAMQSAD